MAGNRVEELEAKVREMEATISGLTDELVETKERVRALEEHVDLQLDDMMEAPARADGASVRQLQGGEPSAADQAQVEEAVAGADGEGSADGATTEEQEGEGDSGTDDIIVA